MGMEAILAVVCLIILGYYWLVRRDHRKTLPGPYGLPIFGYIPFMTSKPYLDFDRLAKKYGPVYSVRLGSRYIVVLNDFATTKEAFAQDAFIGRPPDSPFDLNKETIETEAFNGLPWKEQRRFSLHMLRDLGFGKPRMEEMIREEIQDLLDHFEKSKGNPIVARPILAPSMSNNISIFVFGKRMKYDDPLRIMLDKTLNEAAQGAGQVAWQIFFPWLKSILVFLRIGNSKKLIEANQKFRDYVNKEIVEHESTLDANNIRDYLDGYLLEIQKRGKTDPSFCKKVLEDMTGTFYGAGSETVRLTTDWLLLTMAAFPEVQKKVQQEIDTEIGHHRLPAWTDHVKMPYAEAVIMELMRWRTIIPINILRYTLKDTEINGYFIPKHCIVLANLWAIHHNPEYWGSDSEIFRPERFLTEDGKGIKDSEYFIPFSIGKRACPGKPLANVEVFLYFVSILQKFDIRLPHGKVPDFDGELGIGLQPKSQELCLTVRKEAAS